MAEQGTPEWLAERCGKATASRIGDIMAKTRTGYGASRANYMAELIAERLTGAPAERFQSEAMRWGSQTEAEARTAYEFWTGRTVELAEFAPHPTVAMSGASPDGYIGSDGLVEIKCPNTATHIEYLLGGAIDRKYLLQMQWQMACTGRSWCDWLSYDPRMPDEMRMLVKRVSRDDTLIAEIEAEVTTFLAEVAHKVDQLSAIYLRAAA